MSILLAGMRTDYLISRRLDQEDSVQQLFRLTHVAHQWKEQLEQLFRSARQSPLFPLMVAEQSMWALSVNDSTIAGPEVAPCPADWRNALRSDSHFGQRTGKFGKHATAAAVVMVVHRLFADDFPDGRQ